MSEVDWNYVVDLVDKLSQNETDDQLWDMAKDIVSDLGASALNIGAIGIYDEIPLWFRSSMRAEFIKDYIDQDFVRGDPFVPHFRTSTALLEFVGGAQYSDKLLNGRVGAHSARLRDHNYSRIIGVPLADGAKNVRRGVNFCFDVGSDLSASDVVHLEPRLRLFAAVLSAHMGMPSSPDLPGMVFPRLPRLTDREREVLRSLALGLKNDRIAERTGLAEVTVRKHLASVRSKLGASTREQALVIALKVGLIEV